jgi:hypothetical protein
MIKTCPDVNVLDNPYHYQDPPAILFPIERVFPVPIIINQQVLTMDDMVLIKYCTPSVLF